MPSDVLNAHSSTLSLGELLGRLERYTSGEEGPEMYPWASRFVMGFPLPAWQRPLVWTADQMVCFIQSIWSGVDIGSYLVNDVFDFEGQGQDIKYKEHSQVLLDGQQRLFALESYLFNAFAVPDVHGVPRYWRELPRIERRRFSSFQFSRSTVQSWDESRLRLAYDLRAFGGTPHTDAQRATTDK